MITCGGVFYLMKETSKIYLSKTADIDEQIELFNETFGISFTKTQWERKHYNNPYSGKSEQVCLYKDNKLIGFNLFMPQKYIIKNKEYIFLQSCESAVNKGHRGNGYLKKILTSAEEFFEEKYPLIYGVPNENSKPTFEKLGYIEKVGLNILIAIGVKKSFFKDIFHIFKRIALHGKKNDEAKENIEIRIFDADVKCSDVFFFDHQGTNESDILLDRSKAFYKWKIEKGCDGKYKYFYIERGGKIPVYCVISVNQGSKFKIAEIIDIYVESGYEKDLIKIIRTIKHNCSVISMMTTAGVRN